MKKNNYTVQDKIENNRYLKLLIFTPIILMLALVPLIMRLNVINLDPSVSKYWTTDVQLDIFCYSKAVAIMIITVFMLINLFLFWDKSYIKLDKTEKIIFGAAGVFVFSLIMSTILSEHKLIAIWGAPGRYEGMVIHLCYIITFLYSYIMFKNYNGLKYFKYTLIFLASVMSIIGISQIMGKDILNSKFMFNLMTPSEYKGMFQRTSTDGQIYLTLMNPNYVGTYAALIMPFLLMLCISKYEHKYLRIYSGVLTFLTFFILVKSGSKAGLFAAMCIFALIPIMLYKVILNLKKTTVFITIAVMLFTGIGVNIATGNAIVSNLGKIVNDAKLVFAKDKDYVYGPTYGLPISDLKFKKNKLEINTIYGILNISLKENGKLKFVDEKDEPMDYIYYFEKNMYYIDKFGIEVRFLNIPNKENRFFTLGFWGGTIYTIEWTENNELYYVDGKLNRYEPIVAKSIGFKQRETALSNRGYIWSRTVPLIMAKSVFGYGSDNFLASFPQNDIPAKTYIYWSSSMITDKPHNIYLLYSINNGLVGLFSILTLWLGYILFTFKEFLFKNKYKETDFYKALCILSSIGYMLTGVLNDSVPVIAPIFWVILGVGYAINRIPGEDYER